MSPTQTSDSFPRLTGVENFDVWKARVRAALDGKNLLGFIDRQDYDGASEGESSEASDMSDIDDAPAVKRKHAAKPSTDDPDNQVDYGDSDDELKPESSDDSSGDEPSSNLPTVLDFSASRALQRKKTRGKRKKRPSARELRRLEARTKAFLMKTMDNTHIRLVKDKQTAYFRTL
jgi:gag-polypeptide of LTR copia-type